MTALALGVVLAVNGLCAAGDTPTKLGTKSGTTMTLGGTGTAAQAAASTDDTELACCWRRWCGYGWGGGYGGGYYAGWGGGWGGRYVGYRPILRPYATHYAVTRGGWGRGYYAISGNASDVNAPLVSLNLSVARNPFAVQAHTVTGQDAQPDNGFRYDGGPINPVPLPRPDASPTTQAPATATGLPVSLPKAKPASPYTYKAYGEK
jgi:hypothetical protein